MGDDDNDDDDNNDDDDDTTINVFWSENFDSLSLGDLPIPPWELWLHNATAQVVTSPLGQGNCLKLDDQSTVGAEGAAAYMYLSTYPQVESEFYISLDTVLEEGNRAYTFLTAFYHSYFKIYYLDYLPNEIGVWEGMPGESNYLFCVAVDNSIQHNTVIQVDPISEKYSVYVDGQPTACMDVDFIVSGMSIVGMGVFTSTMEGDYAVFYADNWKAYTLN